MTMNEDPITIDDRKKIWMIVDSYYSPAVKIFTESDPLTKLNTHLHAMETAIKDADYAEKQIAHNRCEKLFNWFKTKDLDNMRIGEWCCHDFMSVECVWLEE